MVHNPVFPKRSKRMQNKMKAKQNIHAKNKNPFKGGRDRATRTAQSGHDLSTYSAFRYFPLEGDQATAATPNRPGQQTNQPKAKATPTEIITS